MAKQLVAKCRQSASLIILAKNSKAQLAAGSKFDYQTLLFSRSETSSFYAKSPVFPGGVYEAADESPLWLEHFKAIGLNPNKLQGFQVARKGKVIPQLFQKQNEDSLEKELSLRITAIRETFEEVGVLLCRPESSLDDLNGYGRCVLDFDRPYWQKAIHNHPSKFLTLCKEMKVVPDLWSLSEWSAWNTPSSYKKRFETAFFMVALKDLPELLLEKKEGTDCTWKSPEEYLNGHREGEFYLPPPQMYELSRCTNLPQLEELRTFAEQRQRIGTVMFLPVVHKCTDGVALIFPGDDCYPADPNASNAPIPVDKTVEEFRQGVKNLNRGESMYSKDGVLHVNIKSPDGQVAPMQFNACRT